VGSLARQKEKRILIDSIIALKESVAIARFLSKIEVKESGCWEWTAALNGDGYAAVNDGGSMRGGHRFAYEYFNNAKIPAGLEIDHLCRNRRCVNPDHLKVVTRRENIIRSTLPDILRGINGSKTHCPHGHPYDLLNTYYNPKGSRVCRICIKEALIRSRKRKEGIRHV